MQTGFASLFNIRQLSHAIAELGVIDRSFRLFAAPWM
jgi:hypothetical protein